MWVRMRALGGGGVASRDRLHDVAVLAAGYALANHVLAADTQVALHLRAQLLDELERHRRLGRFEQHMMEVGVRRDPRVVIGDRVHLRARDFQTRDVLVGDARDRLLDQMRFEQRAHVERFRDPLRAHRGDDRAAMRQRGDPALGFERPQRFANRHA